MVVNGTYKDGTVQLDEKVNLPPGQRVAVELQALPAENGPTVWQELAKLSGVFKGGPRDESVNHDHYLYGAPKREPEV